MSIISNKIGRNVNIAVIFRIINRSALTSSHPFKNNIGYIVLIKSTFNTVGGIIIAFGFIVIIIPGFTGKVYFIIALISDQVTFGPVREFK